MAFILVCMYSTNILHPVVFNSGASSTFMNSPANINEETD